ncbi:hypothetical protein [Risungbinella massiliensis]
MQNRLPPFHVCSKQ